MKIIHRIYGRFSWWDKIALARRGIKIQVGYDRFEIEENEAYHLLKKRFPEPDYGDAYGTIFDPNEVESAEFLVAGPNWASNGYPMPDNDAGFIEQTFGEGNYCKSCGIVRQQSFPFQLKKEPVWKKRKLFGIHWVYDAFFVPVEVYENLFQPKGVEKLEVLHTKKKVPLPNTLQLLIPISTVPLKMQDHPFAICSVCGIKKYDPQNRGFLEVFETPSQADICLSQEFFGSGASAFRKLIVSQKFRSQLIENGVKMQYSPMQNR